MAPDLTDHAYMMKPPSKPKYGIRQLLDWGTQGTAEGRAAILKTDECVHTENKVSSLHSSLNLNPGSLS